MVAMSGPHINQLSSQKHPNHVGTQVQYTESVSTRCFYDVEQ